MAHDEQVKNAKAPFDGSEGDIVVRTSDGVDFHVYKVILSLSSPFFKHMFTLEQPSCAQGAKHTLTVEENSVTLDAILRWCYPIPPPAVADIALFGPILHATAKYEMEEISARARRAFRQLIPQQPLYAYALSCQLDHEEDAATAAKEWRDSRPPRSDSFGFATTMAGMSFSADIGAISAGAYFRLLTFLDGRTIARFCSPADEGREFDDSYIPDPTKSSATYPFTLPDTDFIIRSYDGIDFRVHRLLITLHVDANAANISSLLAPSDSTVNGVPVVMVKEEHRTLAELLSLCYPPFPGTATMISDWSSQKYRDSVKVIRAAQNFGLSSIVRAYRSQFKRHLEDSPLDLYCIAVSFGWEAEARLAAETLADDAVEAIGYTPLLESVQAKEYHRLLQFCHAYRQAVMLRMGVAKYQGWTDVTQWKEEWFTQVVGRSTRMIPSIIVEREVTAARDSTGLRLQYVNGGKLNLKELAKLSAEMEEDVAVAVSRIEL
ncbi:hypothetical protein PHLGIDRAFT_35791 [Phlebiopsis gigantea 11061_1 CR5-6]|uniref:BTB domain-containing protein n=1 Tax=Phlebiopsis gigantea (strain 11061_1 CR5-6) TaxID=745531 RepID=A0A0C3S7F6_PHLG1|nr:hypothetical protein PHLGIDRAFT_35791 [Phlebiopsis gigantea 11061_1 CR5-6]